MLSSFYPTEMTLKSNEGEAGTKFKEALPLGGPTLCSQEPESQHPLNFCALSSSQKCGGFIFLKAKLFGRLDAMNHFVLLFLAPVVDSNKK